MLTQIQLYKINDHILPICIWTCIASLPINSNLVDVIFWLLLLSFLLNAQRWEVLRENKVFLILMIQYPLLNIIYLFLGANDHEIMMSVGEYEMWIYSILGIIFTTTFFDNVTTRRYAVLFLPFSVILTLAYAAYSFHILGDPKVKLSNTMVFHAPLLVTTIAFIVFGVLKVNKLASATFASLLIGSTIILSTAYAGTRGIFIAQLVSLSSASLLLLFLRKYALSAVLIISTASSSLVGLWLDSQINGSFIMRLSVISELSYEYRTTLFTLISTIFLVSLFSYYLLRSRVYFRSDPKSIWQLFTAVTFILAVLVTSGLSISDLHSSIVHTISDAAKSASAYDTSTSYRLQFLEVGLSALESQFLFGLGTNVEALLAQTAMDGSWHYHLHNNYLSWLIWGGFIMLASGLIWLFAPSVLIGTNSDTRMSMTCAMIAIFWSTSLLFDSFFAWKNFTYVYIVLICLGYQISRSRVENAN